MAEFCLDCWNKIMDTDDPPKKFILSRKPDLCEECGEWKPVIIRVKRRYLAGEWFCDCREGLKQRKKVVFVKNE